MSNIPTTQTEREKEMSEFTTEIASLSDDERVIFDEARRNGACKEDALDAVAMVTA